MNTLTCFSLTQTDHIAHLVLNRPEAMNTMHPTFWRELDEVLTQLHAQGTARALVISSTGKHFSAGMALETFAGAIAGDRAPARHLRSLADMRRSPRSKPCACR
jgi:enoyl-CoA hydratase